MKTLKSTLALPVFAALILFAGCGDKKEDVTVTKKDESKTTTTQTQTTTTAPKIGRVWESVQQKTDELNKTIESKKLAGVHEIAFSIRDLVKSLPGMSAGLGNDKVTMLNNHVTEVSKTADLLDKYGDANDYKNTKAQYDIFTGHLDMIKAMYPAESFK
ncbi:hypothetical protein BH10BAC5_BH10BAC5_02330 [soil metagenome]